MEPPVNEELPTQQESAIPEEPQVMPVSTTPDNSLVSQAAQIESEPVIVDPVTGDVQEPTIQAAMNAEMEPTTQVAGDPSLAERDVFGKAPKKSKKPFIIAGALVLLLGLVGGGAVLAYQVYQAPENVVLNAAVNALSASKVQVKTVVTSDFAYKDGSTSIEFQKLTFNVGAERTPKMDANAELSMKYNGTPLDLKAYVLATDDGTVYFKVDNLKTTIKTVLGSSVTISAKAESYLDAIDGKWAKYTFDDIKKENTESGDIAQCTLDVYKKHKDDKAAIQEVADLYKKNAFLVVKDSGQIKDGNVGYEISVDEAKSSAFTKSLDTTIIAKEVKACDKSSTDTTDTSDTTTTDTSSTTTSADGPKTVVTVWVSQWGHELRAIDSKTTDIKSGDSSYSVTSRTDFDFKSGVTSTAPSDTMKAEDWTSNATNFFMDVFLSSYAETGSYTAF